ncbi:hypothetical protein FISHEDRAFT_78017 [Fistulina hepatica ATCC 64428]|nr:hypothetical protein FISHEDRAFT_78017 [Fistulina hepatica ATCC 64428]
MSEFQLALVDTSGSHWKFISDMAIMCGEDNHSQLLFMHNVVKRSNGLQGADCEEVRVLIEMVEEDLAFGDASIDKSIDPHYWLISTPNYPVIFKPLLGDHHSAMEFIDNKARVWKDLVLRWANCQRQILNIHGLLYWVTRVMTEVNSLTEKFETGVRLTNHGLMGCFTFNEQIANAMHRYGIPVWYIRPDWTMTPMMVIQCSSEGLMVTCSSTLETWAFVNDHDEDDPYPVVYDGPTGTFDSIWVMKSGGTQGWQGVSRLMSGPLIRYPQGHIPLPSGKN